MIYIYNYIKQLIFIINLNIKIFKMTKILSLLCNYFNNDIRFNFLENFQVLNQSTERIRRIEFQ